MINLINLAAEHGTTKRSISIDIIKSDTWEVTFTPEQLLKYTQAILGEAAITAEECGAGWYDGRTFVAQRIARLMREMLSAQSVEGWR